MIQLNKQTILYLKSLDLEEAIIHLLAFRFDLNTKIDEVTFASLVRHGIIQKNYINDQIIVTIPLFDGEEGFKNSFEDLEVITGNIKSRINEYRFLFRGIRAKSIGDKNTVSALLTRWLLNNQQYSFDDVVEATRYYMEMTDPKYVSNADNFIFNDKGESTLSIILEQLEFDSGNNKKII